jgi:DNA-binding protein H-NS
MPVNLSKMSLSELKKLSRNIINEIEKRTRQSKHELIKEIKKLCVSKGVAFEELLGLEKGGSTKTRKSTKRANKTIKVNQPKKPLRPVYFHQTDPSKNWSGRGRKPLWVVAWIEQGKDIEKLKTRPAKKITK